MAIMNTATDYLGSQYNTERETNKFLRKYEAQASMSGKLYAKRQPIRYTDWTGEIPFRQEVQTEPYIEMYIPQHRFRELVDQERYVEHLEQVAGDSKDLLDKLRRDERIRSTNPAVEKAWRNYQMLLELARQ